MSPQEVKLPYLNKIRNSRRPREFFYYYRRDGRNIRIVGEIGSREWHSNYQGIHESFENDALNDLMPRLLEGKVTKNFYGPTVESGRQHIGFVTYTVNDLDGIRQLVADLLPERDEWARNVAEKDVEKFEAALVDLKQELAKKEPNQSMIQAGVTSLKNMLESAAGTAVFGGLRLWLPEGPSGRSGRIPDPSAPAPTPAQPPKPAIGITIMDAEDRLS